MDLIPGFVKYSRGFILRHLCSLEFMIQNILGLQNVHCLQSLLHAPAAVWPLCLMLFPTPSGSVQGEQNLCAET